MAACRLESADTKRRLASLRHGYPVWRNHLLHRLEDDGPEYYLSEREVEFAKQQPGRYFVALVGQQGLETARSVRWLFDPLNQCREWTLAGGWSFRETPHGDAVLP